MKLDVYQKAIEALQKKDLRPCPSCGASERTILGFHAQPAQEEFTGEIVFGGQVVPVMTVMCNGCGYLWQYNAIRLGLVPPSPSRPEGSSEGTP